MLFGLGSLSGVASGQNNTQEDEELFHPQVVTGLQDAKSKMSAEAYIGCFVTGLFVTDFAKRAKLGDGRKTLGDLLEGFVCADSEIVGGERYYVSGTMTVNGETGPISSEIIEVPDGSIGSTQGTKTSWALGRFSLAGNEIFRDRRYNPAANR
jgi:hypothetical protein